MSRKYQKFGFRRDKNLSDATNKSEALTNLINNLSTIESESFTADDLYVVNGIRNTKVSNTELKSLANIREVYLNPDTNTLETVRPLINLKDRVDNFKIFTENPIFGPGGDGPLTYLVPLSNINSNITMETTGDQLYNTNNNVIGPIQFWDDGVFVLDNRIYPDFPDPYGLVQWRGFFAKDILRSGGSIGIKTTGLIKIEQNYTGTPNGWEFLKNIYSETIPVEMIGDGTPISTYNVGSYISNLAINQRLVEFENIYILEIDRTTETILLSEPLTLPIGVNIMNFKFDIGVDEVQFNIIPFDSYLNDKIEMRISVWWPDVNNPAITKTFSSNYAGTADNLNFNYFYKSHDRTRKAQSIESIESFIQNRLSGTNQYTNKNITNQDISISTYSPPKLATEKILYPLKTTVTNLGVGKISGTDKFTDIEIGDWILIRPTNIYDLAAVQITEKASNSTVFVNYDTIFPVEIGQDFDITIVRNRGLVGIFYTANGGIFEFGKMNFIRRKIEKNYLCAGLSDTGDNNTNFLRISDYDPVSGQISFADFQSGGQSITQGIAIVYQDKGVVDNSKKSFCSGVIGKETTLISNPGQNSILLTDTTDLYLGQYVQYNGFIPDNTIITQITGNEITISNNIANPIPLGSSIVFSPDNVNREICVLPLNTAPPFEGIETGLRTSTISPGLWVNEIEFKKLNIVTDQSNISTIGETVTYTGTLVIGNGGNSYRILLR